MAIHRRVFLKALAAGGVSFAAAQLGGFRTAYAATSDYRALVCLFFYGGLDNHDLILPYDTIQYANLASLRGSLLQRYGNARARGSLLELTPDNAGDFGPRRFALPPEMPLLQNLFQQGRLAVVGNVGPLIVPTTRQQFESGANPLPPRLFSHNDQQSVWQSSAPEGSVTGWGGQFAALASGGDMNDFSAISSQGNNVFLTNATSAPYSISAEGASVIEYLQSLDAEGDPLATPLRQHFRPENVPSAHLLERDIARLMREAFDTNERYNAVRAAAQPLMTVFPEGELGSQLKAVADSIAVRDELGATRQVFLVGMGGFDTHSQQAQSLPGSFAQIDAALAAFDAAMIELGVDQQVTLFTASDFGRTLAVNGDGTDHGWGAHHFVLGGAVRGKRLYGQIPEARLGHDQDSGGGRLIPTTSVEQYASELGQWFGLNNDQLNIALPNRGNFSTDGLGLFAQQG